MTILFDLHGIQGLARWGMLEADRHKKTRLTTPCFIPRLHPHLLDFKPYRDFLQQLLQENQNQYFLLPELDREYLNMHEQIVAILRKKSVCIGEVTKIPSINDNLPIKGNILSQPYPSFSHSPEFTAHYLSSFIYHVKTDSNINQNSIALFINDNGYPNVLMNECLNNLNERLWGIFLASEDIFRENSNILVDRARLLHERFNLDLARGFSGESTPVEFSHIVNAGFDIITESGLLAKSKAGLFFTNDGMHDIREFREFPCSCEYCKALSRQDIPDNNLSTGVGILIYLHNLLQSFKEVKLIQFHLQKGTFRDYLERQNHGGAPLTVFQRKIDARCVDFYKTNVNLQSNVQINFIGSESYYRPEIVRFRNKVLRCYRFPPHTRYIILLPCSARKPYKQSKSHRRFIHALNRGWNRWKLHSSELIITSPIGAVPRQLERCFPAAHYDIPVTGYWDERELQIAGDMVKSLINNGLQQVPTIDRVLVHLDGGYLQAVEMIEEELNVPVQYTSKEYRASSKDGLEALEKTISDLKITGAPYQGGRLNNLKVLVDYQFETTIGNALFPNKIKIRTIHDNARIVSDADSKQPILKENLHTGIIDLYKEGISRAWNAHLADKNIKLKIVKFCDEFLRGSTLFAPGIDGIIGDINVGDDVFIQAKSGNLAGYGKAILPGKRMEGMKRGAAVEIIEKIKGK